MPANLEARCLVGLLRRERTQLGHVKDGPVEAVPGKAQPFSLLLDNTSRHDTVASPI
jgi:hypothetical protein